MVPKQPKLNLKSRALRFLSLREHSRLELGRKLARYAEEGDDVEAVLDLLEEKRLLSAERFSDALIRRRADNFGNQRILAELQMHGLDPLLLERSKAELAESEVARARAVWQKKFGRPARLARDISDVERNERLESRDADFVKPDDRAKQIRYLMQRGFSSGAIKAALKTALPDNADEFDSID
jgi:regulatory protein